MDREELENEKARMDVEIKKQEVELLKARVVRELAEAECTKAETAIRRKVIGS